MTAFSLQHFARNSACSSSGRSRVYAMTCGHCRQEIHWIVEGEPPSLIECICPRCGTDDAYPKSCMKALSEEEGN